MARVLIVESNESLGQLWLGHLTRRGIDASHVTSQEDAETALRASGFDVIILNLILRGSSAFVIADLAHQLHPEARVIFVTNTSFFSDGSVFALCPNACAHLQADTPPEDLVAMVEHFGRSG
ncbi:response regulator [Roseovarius aestuariivivens]|uniref:response regulator n=1 Tax=Roseovarius aestuariivivens TaxID=1888910 RepID=UPI0010812FBB|nr:response regulator [Roseovarius aestuariivivens]